MREHDEDEAWRAIVANFGERARLDDDQEAVGPTPDPVPEDLGPLPDDDLADEPAYSPLLETADDERYVPPPPPPLPRPHAPRGIAWTCVLGIPLLLLVCTVLGIDLPSLADHALVVGFLGGFTYLLLTMPRGPRDPYDDGARV